MSGDAELEGGGNLSARTKVEDDSVTPGHARSPSYVQESATIPPSISLSSPTATSLPR